jgi:hypothetical protein
MEFRCSVNIAGPLIDSGVGEKEQINIPSTCSTRYVGFQLTCQIAQIKISAAEFEGQPVGCPRRDMR